MPEISLLHIWREEACTPMGIYTYNPADPFDGIETYVVPDEETAMKIIDDLQRQHKGWKFMVESPPAWDPYHGPKEI